MNNQPHGPPGFDRERELEEQHRQRALQQQEELAQREREREHNERQERERQHRDQYQPPPPHQTNTASIPIHQPVASRLAGTIHSPGGLLANHGGAPPSGPLGAPSGPGNAFGGPLHSEANRSIQHNPQAGSSQLQQQQSFGSGLIHHNSVGAPGGAAVGLGGSFQQQQQEAVARLQQLPFGGPPIPQHQIPGAPALGQGGQQPILNDALSYLDQVKVQFADQPDVYNRFLDIMKDFKSQAIDTPGVINRVSELFAGHPNLIQGFNTFLPPGYRIECGAGNDPNTIRVTTPMGTTVQSITGSRALPDAVMVQGAVGGGYYGPQRPGERPGDWRGGPGRMSPEDVFSPQNQNAAPAYGQAPAQHSTYEAQQAAAAAAHQQQQRGVSQLTSAVTATLGHPGPARNAQTPTPGGMNAGGAQLEKRGPVEFNHAISYVNKIKNRFQDRPEIYKQFLEILQTYQRESKPIQDVYAQVTHLFNTAPDLLEDFKQFLPESAAQAKAAAAAKAAEEAQQNQTPQGHGRNEAKLPPVGNFALPASSSKENKKRPRNSTAMNSATQANMGESSHRGMAPGAATNKRTKLNHKQNAPDAPAVSPTLTPIMPEPLPPTSTSSATSEELAFFDRVKKYIANKQTMNEFLKLCNLFSQDLIGKDVLVHKVSNFIGGNPDLMNWFKQFVGYDGREEVIENQPKAPTGRVALSNCRGLGPSYRLLPKRERLRPCSGRDEMCLEVLNDDWASHPTWASEDSGFVAHRKNMFEESLHRIEEERHDYDFNIEANAKVIQLLEPIGQQILSMDQAQRESFRMPIGLGGQSQAIYKRVMKKVYGERGPEVVADLFKDPCAVLPIVLARLKQKDEEWRFTQREWEKVWHAQTQAMYLKSLDHMGIQVKQLDKKNFAAKHLVDAIKTKHEEQRRQRSTKGKAQRYQFSYDFSDREVITDLLRFMVLYASNASQHNSLERRRISDFFEKFVSTFFDVSDDLINECTRDIDRGTPDDDYDEATPSELPNGSGGRGRRAGNAKKSDLRRGVLDKARNGVRGRGQKQDSATGSKESTPDVDSVADDEGDAADEAITEVTNERWAAHPVAAEAHLNHDVEDLELKADQPFKREWYKLYGNQTIFVFFSIFQTLYRRLKEMKDHEAEARAEGIRAAQPKPARDIGLINDTDDYLLPSSGETYYSQTLRLIEDYINGEIEENPYQNWLRRFYLKKGWQIYTILDLLKSLCRQGAICSSSEKKETTTDLIEQFYRNRASEETSFNAEINMRKQADKYVKDGELFLIQWCPKRNEATVQWVTRDETTFDLDDMEQKERWQYYISSYIRIEPTEGVPRSRLHKSVLTRNLPSTDAESEDSNAQPKPILFNEDLTLRVCVNTYKIVYKHPGSEYFIYTNKPLTYDPKTKESTARERLRKFETIRNERAKEKFEMNNRWMRGLDRDAVAKVNSDFKKWMDEGIVPGSEAPATVPADVEMGQ
ncbi:transcriptional regulatory protein-like protein SIN3 [Hyaloscypha hepaticicola]|uniref:Transcriptional regulatory protein-like protein SIN3 n=1 Tax=Hyaloscypha hepaticicola TaxID=2082293 RepID=A0A2J6Q3H5_9HELO|nr:transcriptional regulatory protein-like protein SIN3 [Hyaloscypha hepaticicola]